MSLTPATITRLEKAPVDTGFDQEIPRSRVPLARLMHQLLSPDTSQHQPLEGLGERLREDRHDLPESILQLHPFLADASPLWELTDDPLTIDRRYLRLGSWYVAVVTMKKLPDATYAGSLVPLLRLPIPRYTVSFRVNILDQAAEIAALAKASKMADAWKQASLFGNSKRDDPAVASLQRQKDEALRKAYETSQRLVGVSLSLTILARSAEELDGNVRSALGAMAMARGLAGVREDYALLQAFAAALPGGPELPHALQKCESPVASDLVPIYDFRELPQHGRGDGLPPRTAEQGPGLQDRGRLALQEKRRHRPLD
jgi:hypothetical protein